MKESCFSVTTDDRSQNKTPAVKSKACVCECENMTEIKGVQKTRAGKPGDYNPPVSISFSSGISTDP